MPVPVGSSYTAASGVVIHAGRSNQFAGTAVAFNEFVDQRVFQYAPNSTSKDVTVSGTANGSSVQVRIVTRVLKTEVLGWVTVPVIAGVWSITFTLFKGFWLELQVRDALNNAVTYNSANKFAVGFVCGLAGQSNATGFFAESWGFPIGSINAVEFPSPSHAFRRLGQINDNLTPGHLSNEPGYSFTAGPGNKGNGIVHFANMLSAQLGCVVAMVPRPSNGSSINDWTKGLTNVANNWWKDFASTLTAAGGDMGMLLWQQGETDAATMSPATMLSKLAIVHAQAHTLTGRDASTFAFCIMSLGQGYYLGSTEGQFGGMRATHVQYATSTPGAFLVCCTHDGKTNADFVHQEGTAYNRFGPRVFRGAAAALGFGPSGAGPRIASVVRSGAQLTLNIAHAGGTALTDGLGGTGAALTGYEVKKVSDSTVIAVTSTAIVDNTIVLGLASDPGGAVTFSYAMMNVPHGTDAKNFTPASAVYDNVVIPRSTIGCLMQPLAAITVS